MSVAIRQRSGPLSNGSSLSLGVAALADSVIVGFGVRNGSGAVPIATPGGFTDLGQPLHSGSGDGSAARTWCQAKVAGAFGVGPMSFGDGGIYTWELLELTGADLARVTALSLAQQGPVNLAAFTASLGTFLAARGFAVMVQSVGGNGISSAFVTDWVVPAAGWTEKYDQRIDISNTGSTPMVGLDEATPAGANLVASGDWSTPASSWSKWAGLAVLFSDPPAPTALGLGLSGEPGGTVW